MPFRGLINDELVVPSMVPDHQPVLCPECDGQMYPRDGEERARHFYHVSEDATQTCPKASGESDTHARCTALAAASLEKRFGDQAVRYGVEQVVQVPNTRTEPDYRRADSFVEFQSEHPKFGRGLIIEVQYQNRTKDLQGTTYDYLSAGFSVAWLTPGDFEEERLDLSVVLQAFKVDGGEAYTVQDHDPWEFNPRIEAHLRWDRPSHTEPAGDDHEWLRIPAYAHPDGFTYDYCSCGSRRRYDHENARYVYDYDDVLTPSTSTIDIQLPTDKDSLKNQTIELENGLSNIGAVEPCRGPKGVHQWTNREEYEYTISWSCSHCPVRLVKGVAGDYSIVSTPDTDPRYIIGTPGQEATELSQYCVFCEEFRERTQYGECVECGGHYVVKSVLEVFPANWKPGANSSPGGSAYIHSYFDVTVELQTPSEATEESQERDTPDDEKLSSDSWVALVTWPNHIPLQQARLVPDHGIQAEDEAKAWLYDLLRTVDQQYQPGELNSLGKAFGGAVANSTRASPVVNDDLTCTICGAYLPHYRGDSISSWYQYHYEYNDDDAHPAPDGTGGTRVAVEFDGKCPHCGESPISEHGLIDHLVEHGYSRSDAFRIMNRVW